MNLLLALLVTTVPLDTATFAGGCFWSMERAFDQVTGVVSTTVGYTGGRVKLGHPVPDSNLSSELNSGSPDTTST